MRPVGGLPLIHLEKPRSEAAARAPRAAFFDILGSLVLLTLFAPGAGLLGPPGSTCTTTAR